MTTTKTYTAADIHYFTCSKMRKWAHVPWGMIMGEIPDGVVYPTTLNSVDAASHGMESRMRGGDYTYPAYGKGREYAIIPADRIEVVTEHVEATVMDALRALVESGGKPVEGWKFDDDPSDGVRSVGTIQGVDAEEKTACPFMAGIGYDYEWYRFAYRPVTRVRIKEEVKPKPGYGFTLEGNPVPQPPEGWEIVPEGEIAVGAGSKGMLFDTEGWNECNGWHDTDHTAGVCGVDGQVRAYARRVAKEPLTTETVEQAFRKYWQGESGIMRETVIDAFRAGAAWAKGVQGE